MTRPLLKRLDPPDRVLKRAQYEPFEFSLLDGDIRVRNGSHRNPADHEYRVTVVDGIPATCDCPADTAYECLCKHRVAVAIVLESSISRQKYELSPTVALQQMTMAWENSRMRQTQRSVIVLNSPAIFPAGSVCGLIAETSPSDTADISYR